MATDDGSQDSLKFNVEGALPAGASFDSLGTHIFEWVTTLEDSGTFSIVFSVTDSFPNTSRDTVLITVNNVNRIPQTTLPADTTIMEGTSIVLPLGIIDPDGDAITITYFEVPFGGVINSGGVDTLVLNPTFLQEGVFQLRFTVADNQNGILQHTLQITIENTNRAPSGFSIITPTDGNEIKLTDYLIWEQAKDPDIDDTLSYTLEIDDDPGFWSLDIKIDTVNNFFISNPSIAGGSDGELKLTLEKSSGTGDAFALKVSDIPGIDSLIDDGEFYWRVLGFDNRGGQTGLTPGSHSFHLNLGNDPPLSPSSGIRPVSDASVTVPLPVFRWDAAIDQDLSDGPSTLKYALELSNNNFQLGFDKRVITEPGVDSILSPTFFEDNEIWYFRLSTIDDEGATSPQTPIMKFFINTIQSAPDPFDLILPQDNFGYSSRPDSIFFDWSDSFDPDPGNFIHYRLEISIANDFSNENVVLFIDNLLKNTSSINVSSDVLEKATYYWRVLAIDDGGIITPSSEVRMFGLITSIEEDKRTTVVPGQFEVAQNYPNPFNGQTVIRYSLPYVSPVTIAIFTFTGQLVYKEAYSSLSPGNYKFRWEGNSISNRPVATGVYIAVISTKLETSSQRILLVK